VSGFDLHPEELLDRVRRGRASVAERDQVRAHLRSCEACSFEHAVLAESARDAAPSAGDGERARRIAQAAVASLEAVGTSAARDARAGGEGGSRRKAPRRLAALLAVAVVSSVATAAAAAVMTQPAWLMRILPAAMGGEPAAAREEPAARTVRKKPVRTVEARKPEVAAKLPPEPIAVEAVVVPEREQAAEPAPSPRAAARSATALFAAANVARREGEVGKAARLYRELVRRHARTPEGLVARVTFGRLLLDRLGDARGALREFDAYLGDAEQGTLREEALIGRALALGKLGRAREERKAWTALLAAFPKTGYAERAKARATELRCADGSC
jgi:hypothetical protein